MCWCGADGVCAEENPAHRDRVCDMLSERAAHFVARLWGRPIRILAPPTERPGRHMRVPVQCTVCDKKYPIWSNDISKTCPECRTRRRVAARVALASFSATPFYIVLGEPYRTPGRRWWMRARCTGCETAWVAPVASLLYRKKACPACAKQTLVR